MIDVYRYHRISESTHRIMNPLAHDRMMLAGEICRMGPARHGPARSRVPSPDLAPRPGVRRAPAAGLGTDDHG
jgi:hypothetical protein